MEKPIIKSIIQNTYDAKIDITADEGASIHYTTDGSAPTAESTSYDGPFDYPKANTVIKAIAVLDGEQSDVSSYTCMLCCSPGRLNPMKSGAKSLMITEPLDFCNTDHGSLSECDVIIIGNGSINNVQSYMNMGMVYPLGLDFDRYFINAGNFSKYTWKAGQILTKDNKAIRFDGENWHTLQEIYSGSFAKRPGSSIPVGFAYFCTDKHTTEGARNGIVIYYAGNGTWVDALGRTVE